MKALEFTKVEDIRHYLENNLDKGYILFADNEIVQDMSEFASDNIVLCSTAGEFAMDGYKEHHIVGFEYDRSIADIVEIKKPAIKSMKHLQRSYEKVKNNPNAFLMLLCDGLTNGEEQILSSLFFISNDFKIIGGSAGDYLKFDQTHIFIGKRRVYSVGIFFDMKKRTQLIKENIYHQSGKKMLVTSANPINRRIITLNHEKPIKEYAKALGVDERSVENEIMNHPFGRVTQDEIFIASPMKMNDDGTIQLYSQILPDTFIEVLEPSNLEECFERTVNELQFRPQFIFSVHCIIRSLKFKEEGTWKQLEHHLLHITNNQVGFISYGEQLYKRHLNQTMVLLAVEE